MINDVLDFLDSEWNVAVTPKPQFLLFNKNIMMGGNYVAIRLDNRQELIIDLAGSLINETGWFSIYVSSNDTEAKCELMADEVRRILSLVITGYDFNHLLNEKNVDESTKWTRIFTMKIYKFLKTRGT